MAYRNKANLLPTSRSREHKHESINKKLQLFCAKVRLPLGTHAPIMTPNGTDLSLLSARAVECVLAENTVTALSHLQAGNNA